MPFTLGDSMPERVKRDGCDCPAWVIRCVHFNGALLMVAKKPEAACSQHWAYECFTLVPARPLSKRHPCCAVKCWDDTPGDVAHYTGQSEADAIAAFEAEEARLLCRDA